MLLLLFDLKHIDAGSVGCRVSEQIKALELYQARCYSVTKHTPALIYTDDTQSTTAQPALVTCEASVLS